MKAIPKSG